MRNHHVLAALLTITWLSACGQPVSLLTLDDSNSTGGTGGTSDPAPVYSNCGNGVVEEAEECDDGNLYNGDECTNNCTKYICGDGYTQLSEQCDDGNDDNGDECTNECRNAACGDGYVQPGEQCDLGEKNGNSTCGSDCAVDACWGASPSFLGVVSNADDPKIPGDGVGALWIYKDDIGFAAGEAMCQAIGAVRPCTYHQVKAAEAKGELKGLPVGTRFWIHRMQETVFVPETATLSKPGPGGSCNQWTHPSDVVADSEWAGVDPNGDIYYYFDDDTLYTGTPSDHHQGNGYEGEIGKPGTGHGGHCGSQGKKKAILCCNACPRP